MNNFESQMRDVLRSSERELDAETTERLAKARSTALSTATKWQIPRFFVPATSMALASVLALFLVLSPGINEPQLNQDEILLSEGVDLYEDMDFYYWLADEANLQS